jgi:hypothetical protein
MDRLVEILERENRLELAKRSFTQIPLLVDLDLLGYQYLFEHHGPLTRN